MPTTRSFVIIATIAALLASGFPVFNPGDADHDQMVDLRDAVIRAMAFVHTADSPGAFQENMAGMLTALKATAGLKTVIKANNPDTHKSGSTSLNSPFFIATYHFDPPLVAESCLIEKAYKFSSISVQPALPPPRPFLIS